MINNDMSMMLYAFARVRVSGKCSTRSRLIASLQAYPYAHIVLRRLRAHSLMQSDVTFTLVFRLAFGFLELIFQNKKDDNTHKPVCRKRA